MYTGNSDSIGNKNEIRNIYFGTKNVCIVQIYILTALYDQGCTSIYLHPKG